MQYVYEAIRYLHAQAIEMQTFAANSLVQLGLLWNDSRYLWHMLQVVAKEFTRRCQGSQLAGSALSEFCKSLLPQAAVRYIVRGWNHCHCEGSYYYHMPQQPYTNAVTRDTSPIVAEETLIDLYFRPHENTSSEVSFWLCELFPGQCTCAVFQNRGEGRGLSYALMFRRDNFDTVSVHSR